MRLAGGVLVCVAYNVTDDEVEDGSRRHMVAGIHLVGALRALGCMLNVWRISVVVVWVAAHIVLFATVTGS